MMMMTMLHFNLVLHHRRSPTRSIDPIIIYLQGSRIEDSLASMVPHPVMMMKALVIILLLLGDGDATHHQTRLEGLAHHHQTHHQQQKPRSTSTSSSRIH